MTSDLALLRTIISHEGIEYAVCDAERRIVESSPGLPALLGGESVPATLAGQRLEECCDEFKDIEEELARVARGETPYFQVAHTYRERYGEPCYVTLTVLAHPPGLLLLVTDTTQEAQLAQRLTQERNEVLLLQGRLKEANAQLEYLLRHFVPTNVTQQLLAQRELPHPGGKRRTVSVLFADMRNFTALAETLEPEAVMERLNQNFSIISRLVIQYGGTLNQYIGDGIMAIFNAPQDQPDHALCAVRVGLEIIQAATLYPQYQLARFGFSINTGPAVVGYLGFEERFDYTAIGDTVNVAARLSALAREGQILIGPQTYEAVCQRVRTRPVDLLKLKGKVNPLMVYEVLPDERLA